MKTINNSKRINTKNQEVLKGFFLSQEFLSDPEVYFERMSKAQRDAFDVLIKLWRQNGDGFSISNQKLANIMGCSYATVNRWKAEWVKHGLLKSEAVFVSDYGLAVRQQASKYFLSNYFKLPDTESLLGYLLPSLKLLTIALLAVFSSYSSQDNLYNQKYNNLNIIRRDIRNLTIRRTGYAWDLVRRSGRMGLKIDDVIPSHVHRITELNLTNAGKMRLSVYPGAAILDARGKIKITKKFIKDPFAYFVSLCEQYCKDNDIRPDWNVFELSKKVFHWQPGTPMLKSFAVNAKGLCKSTTRFRHPGGTSVQQSFLKREQNAIASSVPALSNETNSIKGLAESSQALRIPFKHYQTSNQSSSNDEQKPLRVVKEISWQAIQPRHKEYTQKPTYSDKALNFLALCGIKAIP